MKSYYMGALKKRAAMDKAGAMLTDEQAVECKELYRQWEKLIGITITADDSAEGVFKFLHGEDLYKYVGNLPHTFSAEWEPGVGTESIYVRIDESHAGTYEDPIPYDGNMVLETGKYYSQDGIIYLCTRDTVNPVVQPLSELVGLYVEVA